MELAKRLGNELYDQQRRGWQSWGIDIGSFEDNQKRFDDLYDYYGPKTFGKPASDFIKEKVLKKPVKDITTTKEKTVDDGPSSSSDECSKKKKYTKRKKKRRDDMVHSSGSSFKGRGAGGKRYYTYKRSGGKGYKKYKRGPAGVSGRRIIKICDTVLKRRMEKKYHINDNLVWNTNTLLDPGTTSCYSITNVLQGNTDVTRIGDKLWISALLLRFTFKLYPESTSVNGQNQTRLRIIVFQWLDSDNYNAPTVAKLMNDNSDFWTSWNHDNGAMYYMLHDQFYNFSDNNPCRSWTIPIIPKFRKIDYTSGGTSGNKKIYVLVMGDSFHRASTGSTVVEAFVPYTLQLHSKMTFYDS